MADKTNSTIKHKECCVGGRQEMKKQAPTLGAEEGVQEEECPRLEGGVRTSRAKWVEL